MAEKGTNLHHHFWTRRDWTERRIDKLVRDHPLSKSIMDIRIHSELHRHVEPVKPPVEREMSSRVFRMLQDAKTSYTPLDAAKMMADAGIPELSSHLRKQIPFLELSKEALRKRVV